MNYSSLLKWQQLQDEFEKGKEFPVFTVNSQEEAEKLKEALDGEKIFIIVDDLSEEEEMRSENSFKQTKTIRKKGKGDS